MGYQPTLTKEILEGIETSDLKIKESRATINRVKHIINFLRSKNIDFKNTNCIDVGCNDGVFSNTLSYLGMTCFGIENDNIVSAGHMGGSPIQTAIKTAEELGINGSYFFKYDVIDFFNKNNQYYDISLVLSIMHNLFLHDTFRKGNPTNIGEICNCFKNIWDNTKNIMFFENDDNFKKTSLEVFKDILGDVEITKLCTTPAYNGDRVLYAITRKIPITTPKYMIIPIKISKGTGTESSYIESNYEYFKKMFDLKELYKGSLNFNLDRPIVFKKHKFGIKLNYKNKTYKLGEVKINNVKGYLAQTSPNMYEFFCDREIKFNRDEILKLEVEL